MNMSRNGSVLLVGALVVSLAACAPERRKSPRSDDGDAFSTADTGGAGTDVSTSPDAFSGPDTNTQPDAFVGIDTSTQPDVSSQPDTSTQPDVVQQPDTNPVTPGSCDGTVPFTGQVYDQSSQAHHGGTPTTTPLTGDGNLQAVVARFVPAGNADPAVVLSPSIQVTNVTIIASAHETFARRNFWVQDGNAAVRVYLNEDAAPFIQVGMRVSFSVDELKVFDGHGQISRVSNFNVLNSNNPVPYVDRTGQDLTMNDYARNVRLSGRLGPNPGTACGGSSLCYDLHHGANKVATFRSASNFVSPGDCVIFFGPMMSFPGPLDALGAAPRPQVDTINFAWYLGLD